MRADAWSRGWRWAAPLGAVLGILALWSFVVQPRLREARRRSVLGRLPSLPGFELQNRRSIERFREADRRARGNPLAAEAVGRLGMLYHAYQFEEEARGCYRLALELAPREFRWSYYLAVLEEAAYHFREAESRFRRATELRPDSADAWARLGDLQLKSHRLEEAEADFRRALQLDPLHPLASLGQARLAMFEREWQDVVDILTRLLERYPRLSMAHKYLSRAYAELGLGDEQAKHVALGEYGSASDGALMKEIYDLSVPAILEGDPTPGPGLLKAKCARCHTHGRIYETERSRRWWAATVRRMQRLAGWAWLTDEEAASVVAYLAGGTTNQDSPP
ncbi:MAG: tetratricopeptide repeat protein [Acidobacteriota bacterium]